MIPGIVDFHLETKKLILVMGNNRKSKPSKKADIYIKTTHWAGWSFELTRKFLTETRSGKSLAVVRGVPFLSAGKIN